MTLKNRYAALQEDTKPEPDVIPVRDSFVSGQSFCRGRPNRKYRCYPGRKVENITERVDNLVENSKNTLFVNVVGTSTMILQLIL